MIKDGDSCREGEITILCLGGLLRTKEVQKYTMNICELPHCLFAFNTRYAFCGFYRIKFISLSFS